MYYRCIADVVPGDIIVENGGRTTVTKVDTTICRNKVHINDRDCYENFAEVKVQD